MFELVKKMINSVKAEVDIIMSYMPDPISGAMGANEIVTLVIAIFILAALLPSAMTSIFAANTTAWSATTILMWGILPVIIIAVIVLKFYKGGE